MNGGNRPDKSSRDPAPSDPPRGCENSTPAFRALTPPARLLVPCLWDSDNNASLQLRAPDLLIPQGEPLVEPHPSLRHLPVAPFDGRILGLGRAALLRHQEVPAVIFAPAPTQPPDAPTEAAADFLRPLREAPLAEWIDRLRAGGVWAERWSSPDLIAQLHRCLTRPVDTVICNLLDLDPAVPLQAMTASHWAEEVVSGVRGIASLTGAGRSWIVAPTNLPPVCAQRVRAAAAGTDVRIVPVENRYPLAHPSLLLQGLIGRLVRFGASAVEQGVLIFDAAASLAMGNVFLHRQPMTTVPLGIFDQKNRRSHFVQAPIGITLADLLERIGMRENLAILSSGTPLHEWSLSSACVVGGRELTVYAAPRSRDMNPEPCIRCAWCVEACPVNIQPAALLEAAQNRDPQSAEDYGLPACIECGICSFVCPSNLPLLAAIRILRKTAEGRDEG